MNTDDAIEYLRAQGYAVQAPKADNTPDDFAEFWAVYPKRPNNVKAAALKSWQRITKNTDGATIVEALRAQVAADMFSDEPKFIPMASTWLNQARWENAIVPRSTTAHSQNIDALSKFMMED